MKLCIVRREVSSSHTERVDLSFGDALPIRVFKGSFQNSDQGGEAGQFDVSTFSAESIGGLLYLIFVGSIPAYFAYIWVLGHAPVSKVATYAYVNPVIAVFLGWAVLSEDVTATVLIGWTHRHSAPESIVRVSFEEALERVQRGAAMLLDVRERSEYAAGHVAGALNIPLGHLALRVSELSPERPIAVHCGHGNRSSIAVSG